MRDKIDIDKDSKILWKTKTILIHKLQWLINIIY